MCMHIGYLNISYKKVSNSIDISLYLSLIIVTSDQFYMRVLLTYEQQLRYKFSTIALRDLFSDQFEHFSLMKI